MRVVHDQVIPLLDDSFCEGVVLIELAQAALNINLRRKEAFYKYLAMQKFQEAEAIDESVALFTELAKLTRTGYELLDAKQV